MAQSGPNQEAAAMMSTLKHLAAEIGPRRAGSQAENDAARYVHQRMTEAGLTAELQPVRVQTHQHLPSIIGFSLLVTAAILLSPIPPLAAACALAGIGVLLAEATATPLLSRLLPQSPSHNVVGRRPAMGTPQRAVVFTAHLDTAQPTLFAAPRAALLQRQAYVFALNSGLIILVLAAVATFTRLESLVWIGFAAGLYLIVHLAVTLHGVMELPASPGANHNGSGLAVLVQLAEQMPALEQVDTWFVADAGHVTGMAGLRAFLARAGLVPQTTLLVNLEGVGSGAVTLSLLEGFARAVAVPRVVLGIAAEVVARLKLPAQARPFQQSNSSAYVALRARIPAITVHALDRRGALPNWQWTTDTIDAIEPMTLEVAAQLAQGLAQKLDQELVARSNGRTED